MRERIAQVLELDVEQVNVKAKTAEKLGACGSAAGHGGSCRGLAGAGCLTLLGAMAAAKAGHESP
jgi:hypothetical protein